MINSLFIIAADGSVLVEKHYRVVLSRTVVEFFMDEARKAPRPDEVLPVIPMQRLLLVHVQSNNLFYLAVVTSEVPPLLVIEFLNRVADIFKDYFGDVTEFSIKDNFIIVYQLLEELMDNGFPLTTEPNILKEMIAPPTMLNKMAHAVTSGSGVNAKLPGGTLSIVPWRKTGVKYSNNEIYFDIIENVDAIIDTNGTVVSSDIHGEILVNCQLSGMPDITLHFQNPQLLDDVSFHPCIRLNRYERDRVLSFVPPDGRFQLMSFRVNTGPNFQMPIYVKPQIFFSGGAAKIDVSVGARHTGGRPVEAVRVFIPLPSSTLSVNLTVNHGSFEFDPISKMLRWDIGRLPKEKIPMMGGNAVMQPGAEIDGSPTLTAEFRINMFSTSGLKINSVNIINETYKPYKGVKSITQSGKFQIRS